MIPSNTSPRITKFRNPVLPSASRGADIVPWFSMSGSSGDYMRLAGLADWIGFPASRAGLSPPQCWALPGIGCRSALRLIGIDSKRSSCGRSGTWPGKRSTPGESSAACCCPAQSAKRSRHRTASTSSETPRCRPCRTNPVSCSMQPTSSRARSGASQNLT